MPSPPLSLLCRRASAVLALSPHLHHDCSKTSCFSSRQLAAQTITQRLIWVFLFVRRQDLFFFALLIYISSMLSTPSSLTSFPSSSIAPPPAPSTVAPSCTPRFNLRWMLMVLPPMWLEFIIIVIYFFFFCRFCFG